MNYSACYGNHGSHCT